MSSKIEDFLWVEKYRPREVNDMILTGEQNSLFSKWVEEKEFPHALFIGKPGSGKTTMARILVEKIIDERGMDLLELNGSTSTGVDVVRNLIEEFLKTVSVGNSKIKIVFIDEFDYMSRNAQASLRNVIETYGKTGRFLLTANYEYKIDDAILSRIPPIRFKQLPGEYITDFCKVILDKEKVKYQEDVIEHIVNIYKPDVRRIINLLQNASRKGDLVIDRKSIETNEFKVRSYLADLIHFSKKSDFTGAIRTIENINEILKENEVDYEDIISKVFDDEKIPYEPKPLMADYYNKSVEVPIPRINFMAMCYSIVKLFRERKNV